MPKKYIHPKLGLMVAGDFDNGSILRVNMCMQNYDIASEEALLSLGFIEAPTEEVKGDCKYDFLDKRGYYHPVLKAFANPHVDRDDTTYWVKNKDLHYVIGNHSFTKEKLEAMGFLKRNGLSFEECITKPVEQELILLDVEAIQKELYKLSFEDYEGYSCTTISNVCSILSKYGVHKQGGKRDRYIKRKCTGRI